MLATGLVVDDAIVVLENIVRRRAQGIGPRAAAVLGTQQVFFAVVATTTTLAAVFVPLSFLPGQTGALFREFGITLALSVAISAFVALSLCPMMASRMLRGRQRPQRRNRRALGAVRRRLEAGYHRALHAALDAPLVVLALGGVFGVTALLMFAGIRAGADPARGPRGGDAAGHRAAGGEPRLYREQAARDRGAHGAPARLRRGGRALLDRRLAAATTAAS